MPDFSIEIKYHPLIVAGVDEAGRGPLAGPVVAAAVIILPEQDIIENINDSKKLSIKQRYILSNKIKNLYQYNIGLASVEEIDELNILEATKLACHRAVNGLNINPEIILIDGNMKFADTRYKSIIKGDNISLSIAAASIVAKVFRDELMQDLAISYPAYGWDKNMGYGTKDHIAGLKLHGPTIHHRKLFIRKFI